MITEVEYHGQDETTYEQLPYGLPLATYLTAMRVIAGIEDETRLQATIDERGSMGPSGEFTLHHSKVTIVHAD